MLRTITLPTTNGRTQLVLCYTTETEGIFYAIGYLIAIQNYLISCRFALHSLKLGCLVVQPKRCYFLLFTFKITIICTQ